MDSDQVSLQLLGAGLLAPGMGEAIREAGVPVHLHQQRGDRHVRQHPLQLAVQFLSLGSDVLRGQRGDDQLAIVIEADRPVALLEGALQVAESIGEFVHDQGQCLGVVRALADQAAELRPVLLPLGGLEQVGGRVVVRLLRDPATAGTDEERGAPGEFTQQQAPGRCPTTPQQADAGQQEPRAYVGGPVTVDLETMAISRRPGSPPVSTIFPWVAPGVP
ncbi:MULTISPECIES: hypothetical protein [Streptomyces]|uniref:hypothetical protein n=1 Tax=Streptomyces lycopersici TaxID=2974589 RepID=UPI0035259DE7